MSFLLGVVDQKNSVNMAASPGEDAKTQVFYRQTLLKMASVDAELDSEHNTSRKKHNSNRKTNMVRKNSRVVLTLLTSVNMILSLDKYHRQFSQTLILFYLTSLV